MNMFSVFGNKARIKIIACIGNDEKSVTELIDTCGLSQSAVSQHLSKLRESKLVGTKKIGKEVFYFSLFPEAEIISTKLLKLEKELNNATSILQKK